MGRRTGGKFWELAVRVIGVGLWFLAAAVWDVVLGHYETRRYRQLGGENG